MNNGHQFVEIKYEEKIMKYKQVGHTSSTSRLSIVLAKLP